MKTRIGNPLNITWTLPDRDGSPYDLTGKPYRVLMYHVTTGIAVPMHSTVEVNVIRFVFDANMQPGAGQYNMLLEENKGGIPMVTYDVKNVVELVEHSWQEAESSLPEGVEIEAVKLESTVVAG